MQSQCGTISCILQSVQNRIVFCLTMPTVDTPYPLQYQFPEIPDYRTPNTTYNFLIANCHIGQAILTEYLYICPTGSIFIPKKFCIFYFPFSICSIICRLYFWILMSLCKSFSFMLSDIFCIRWVHSLFSYMFLF